MKRPKLTKSGTPRQRAEGGGRRAEYGARQPRTTVTLPARHTDALRAHGGGYVSRGIRRLAEEHWPELTEE